MRSMRVNTESSIPEIGEGVIDLEVDYKYIKSLKEVSTTTQELVSITKEIWLERLREQKAQEQIRKNDLRSKIMMGGLIKKAGLDDLHPDRADVLYGMLLDAKRKLDTDPRIVEEWGMMGRDLSSVSKSYGKLSHH